MYLMNWNLGAESANSKLSERQTPKKFSRALPQYLAEELPATKFQNFEKL